jgi:hypothetical protein
MVAQRRRVLLRVERGELLDRDRQQRVGAEPVRREDLVADGFDLARRWSATGRVLKLVVIAEDLVHHRRQRRFGAAFRAESD